MIYTRYAIARGSLAGHLMWKRKFMRGTAFRDKRSYWVRLTSVAVLLVLILLNGTSHAHLQNRQAIESGGDVVEEGNVRYPLAGFIRFTNVGTPIQGMRVECFTQGGRHRVGTTYTDASGHFSFPKLPEGRYLLKARMHGVISIRTTVNATRKSKNILDLITEAIDCEDTTPGNSGVPREIVRDSCR
jgi:hypothetical protein